MPHIIPDQRKHYYLYAESKYFFPNIEFKTALQTFGIMDIFTNVSKRPNIGNLPTFGVIEY